MKSKTATFRALMTPRVLVSAVGIMIALTGLAAFLNAIQLLPLEATLPAVGRALPPLGEWRQISALLLVALGIAIQLMLPEKLPDRLPIRQGVEDADTRGAEKRQTGWCWYHPRFSWPGWIRESLSAACVPRVGCPLTGAVLINRLPSSG
jgi:hypothetical protein